MAMLSTSGRVSVDTVSDEEAVATFLRIARSEGIIPALESAHALAFAIRLAATRPPTERILVNLSGRGDKDVDFVLARNEFSRSDGGSALDNRPATLGPTAPVIGGKGISRAAP
jgi:tryptophan synthase beta chain